MSGWYNTHTRRCASFSSSSLACEHKETRSLKHTKHFLLHISHHEILTHIFPTVQNCIKIIFFDIHILVRHFLLLLTRLIVDATFCIISADQMCGEALRVFLGPQGSFWEGARFTAVCDKNGVIKNDWLSPHTRPPASSKYGCDTWLKIECCQIRETTKPPFCSVTVLCEEHLKTLWTLLSLLPSYRYAKRQKNNQQPVFEVCKGICHAYFVKQY